MKLKELRLNAKLSQDDIAKILKITQATYSNYEKGNTQPPFDILIRIADYYKVTLDYLLERNNFFGLNIEEYELLNNYKKLNEFQKHRLIGYLNAILDENKE